MPPCYRIFLLMHTPAMVHFLVHLFAIIYINNIPFQTTNSCICILYIHFNALNKIDKRIIRVYSIRIRAFYICHGQLCRIYIYSHITIRFVPNTMLLFFHFFHFHSLLVSVHQRTLLHSSRGSEYEKKVDRERERDATKTNHKWTSVDEGAHFDVN